MTTIVYTDGACSGNPGPGGWAWAIVGGAFAAGAASHATNQRMEITAAYQALLSVPPPLEVRSDSTYVVNCFRDRWWEGWLARGWKNSQRKDVANRDLWEPFVARYRKEITGALDDADNRARIAERKARKYNARVFEQLRLRSPPIRTR